MQDIDPLVFVALLHSLQAIHPSVILEIRQDADIADIALLTEAPQASAAERLVRGIVPQIEAESTEIHQPRSDGSLELRSYLIRPNDADCLPLRSVKTLGEIDPLGAILGAGLPHHPDEATVVRFQVRALPEKRRARLRQDITGPVQPRKGIAALLNLFLGAPCEARFDDKLQRILEQRLEEPSFELVATLLLRGRNRVVLQSRAQALSAVFSSLSDAGYGSFRTDWHFGSGGERVSFNWPERVPCTVVSCLELAPWFRPPSSACGIPGVRRQRYLSPVLPTALFRARGPIIGTIRQRGEERLIPLPRESFRHGTILCTGVPGQGKSTLVATIVAQELAAPDQPAAVILDPPGTLVSQLVERCIPAGREQDVVLLRLGDGEHPVALPIPERRSDIDQDVLISSTYGALRGLFQDTGYSESRMDSTLYALAAGLCCIEGATLWDAQRLFYEPSYRTKALALTDPVAGAWWANLERSTPAEVRQQAQPVLTRLEKLYRSRPLRAMLLQRHAPPLMELLDRGAIVLVSLAGNAIQEEISLLGEILLARLKMQLWSRLTDGAMAHRRVILAVDEAHRMKGVTLPQLLREGRKTGLVPQIISTQYLSGWSEPLSESVMGTLGTLITFRSPNDSERLARLLPPLTGTQLATLDRHTAAAAIQLDEGATLPAFCFQTRPVTAPPDPDRLERVLTRSRARFTRPRALVEAELTEVTSVGDRRKTSRPAYKQVNDVDEE